MPAWRDTYLGYLEEVATEHLTRARHTTWIGEAAAVVGPAADRDPNPPDVGTGATYASQIDPAGEGAGNLFGFVDAKRAFLLERLAALRRP